MKKVISKTTTLIICVCIIILGITPDAANAASYKINLKKQPAILYLTRK